MDVWKGIRTSFPGPVGGAATPQFNKMQRNSKNENKKLLQ